jgi:hypothetical protein
MPSNEPSFFVNVVKVWVGRGGTYLAKIGDAFGLADVGFGVLVGCADGHYEFVQRVLDAALEHNSGEGVVVICKVIYYIMVNLARKKGFGFGLDLHTMKHAFVRCCGGSDGVSIKRLTTCRIGSISVARLCGNLVAVIDLMIFTAL